MICTSMTLHPEWNAEHRSVRVTVSDPASNGTGRQVGVFVKERCGADCCNSSQEFAVYGPGWVVLATLDEMRRAVVAALQPAPSPSPTFTEAEVPAA